MWKAKFQAGRITTLSTITQGMTYATVTTKYKLKDLHFYINSEDCVNSGCWWKTRKPLHMKGNCSCAICHASCEYTSMEPKPENPIEIFTKKNNFWFYVKWIHLYLECMVINNWRSFAFISVAEENTVIVILQ